MPSTAKTNLRLLPLAAALALPLASAHAAKIVVNDPGEGSVPGKCTITDAVAAVNNAVAQNGCVAGDGNHDLVDLTGFTSATTITFTVANSADGNSALEFTRAATLRAGVDANGNPLVRLRRSSVTAQPRFRLLSSMADLTVDGIGISQGYSENRGGGIYARGNANLTLINSTVGGNYSAGSGGGVEADCGDITVINSGIGSNTALKQGGGIYASDYINGGGGAHCKSIVTVSGSKIHKNYSLFGSGAGIYSFNGSVYVDNSTVDYNGVNNTYGIGGGIFAYYSAIVTGSTISYNGAAVSGGGIHAHYARVVNSTLLANDAGQDGAIDADTVSIAFSTITQNMARAVQPIGGVGFGTSANVVASIITGNNGDNILGGGPVTGDHNIIAPGTNGFSQTFPGDTRNCDPKLGYLSDNGGSTHTMALLTGSCAIDTGPVSAPPGLASDQRGRQFARKVGAATDVGAYEMQTNERIFYDGFDTT